MILTNPKISLEEAFDTELHYAIEELTNLGDFTVAPITTEIWLKNNVQSRIAMLSTAVQTTQSFVESRFTIGVKGLEDVTRIDKELRGNKDLRTATLEARFQRAVKPLRDIRVHHPDKDRRLYDSAIAYGALGYSQITGHHPKV